MFAVGKKNYNYFLYKILNKNIRKYMIRHHLLTLCLSGIFSTFDFLLHHPKDYSLINISSQILVPLFFFFLKKAIFCGPWSSQISDWYDQDHLYACTPMINLHTITLCFIFISSVTWRSISWTIRLYWCAYVTPDFCLRIKQATQEKNSKLECLSNES